MEYAAERLAAHLEDHKEQDLSDMSYGLATRRREFEWRRVAVGASREELVERLRKGTGRGAGAVRSRLATGQWPLCWRG